MIEHFISTFLGFFPLALSFSNFQKFSIGFMSGLWAGHSITVTSFSERYILTIFAVWHRALNCINSVCWLIAVLKLGTCFFNISLYTFVYICANFTVYPNKRSCTSYRNHAKHHHTSSSKFNAAFSALRQISFLGMASNEPSPVASEQVKFWLIAEKCTRRIQWQILIGSFCPLEM